MKKNGKLLGIEDSWDVRATLQKILPKYSIDWCLDKFAQIPSIDIVLDKIRSTSYDLVLLDWAWGKDEEDIMENMLLRLDEPDFIRKVKQIDEKDYPKGLFFLKYIKENNIPTPPIIIMSQYENVPLVKYAMNLGAFWYLNKAKPSDYIELIIEKTINVGKLFSENIRLKFESIIGESQAIKKVILEAKIAAENDDLSVLITGETGTGKELVAREIHSNSIRKRNPFVIVLCTALTPGLEQSELFGHTKGAFTNATEAKKGKFELANKGIIFLDEIGDMSLQTQSKILRVIENGEVQKLGQGEDLKVDVRVIAATNKNLAHEVKNKNFRKDLYYRLRMYPIHIPPLRDRKDDIGLLVNYYLKKLAENDKKYVDGISEESLNKLRGHDWPGNIRELLNSIKRARAKTQEGEIITPDKFVFDSENEINNTIFDTKNKMSLKKMKEKWILKMLAENNNDIERTADQLEISSKTIRRILKEVE